MAIPSTWLRWTRCLQIVCMASALAMNAQSHESEGRVKHPVLYGTIQADGLSIFYREAGSRDAPTLLLLHGLPSSSRMFLSFDAGEPERYRSDVPNAEVHVLDAGHFALDTKADEIAALVRQFMTAVK